MFRPVLLAIVVLVTSLASCGDALQGKPLAESAVVGFHADYNAGNLRAIYQLSDSKMKASTPEPEFMSFMEAVQRKLGKHQSTTDSGWQVNTRNLKTTVVVTKKSTFEHGEGMETFTYSISDGAAKLVGYKITSKELVLK